MASLTVMLLSAEVAQDVAHRLVELDGALFRELGRSYAEAPWGEANLLAPRPQKWDLSVVAKDVARPVGFWVASQRAAGIAYAHRVGVDAAYRRRGVGAALLQAAGERARRLGMTALALSVASGNVGARDFYARAGFVPAPAEVMAALAMPQAHTATQTNQYVTAAGATNEVHVLAVDHRA